MGKVKLQLDRLKDLSPKHKQRIAAVLCGLAVLMLVDTIFQIGRHVQWRYWIPQTLAAEGPTTQPATTQPATSQPTTTQPATSQPTTTQPTTTQPVSTQPAGDAGNGGRKSGGPSGPSSARAAIKRRNIMAPPKPKGHGMTLTGVLGNVALFVTRDGATVGIEAGQTERGVRVTGIDGYSVTIEFAGKTETMRLFPGGTNP